MVVSHEYRQLVVLCTSDKHEIMTFGLTDCKKVNILAGSGDCHFIFMVALFRVAMYIQVPIKKITVGQAFYIKYSQRFRDMIFLFSSNLL